MERIFPASWIEWDYLQWYSIHQWNQAPWMDLIMPLLRNQWTWAPLYLFLALFFPLNFGRRGWLWCLGFLLCFAIADYGSASLLKPYFARLRPCNDPLLLNLYRELVPCGSGYSFPSSHASNHFALGGFICLTIGRRYWWTAVLALLWAASISFAQVYVGVHFPLDVLFGALYGLIVALLVSWAFRRWVGLYPRPDSANGSPS